jgi:hypothetical protein
VGNTDFNVLQYYCLKSPFPESVSVAKSTRWTQNLINCVRFIYITTDDTIHRRKKSGGFKTVIRINGDSLQQFGLSAEYFKNK